MLKRSFDLIAGSMLLLLAGPVMLVCALATKLDSAGPVLFRQERLGWGGTIFRICKLRTMVPGAANLGAGLHQEDPRITRVGRLLRKSRLDELPQLLNVLRGEMSLVGPRPLLPEYLAAYSEEDRKRLLMPQGMTGWQQVTGGARHTWEERIAADVWYVEHWSLWLDMVILFRTVWVVLKADSVYGIDGWQQSGLPDGAQTSVAPPARPGGPEERQT